MSVQVRTQVNRAINAQVHYIAKTLGVKVSDVYEMIIVAYLTDHDMQISITDLARYIVPKSQSEPIGSETGPARED